MPFVDEDTGPFSVDVEMVEFLIDESLGEPTRFSNDFTGDIPLGNRHSFVLDIDIQPLHHHREQVVAKVNLVYVRVEVFINDPAEKLAR
jgi:hypothetical protein